MTRDDPSPSDLRFVASSYEPGFTGLENATPEQLRLAILVSSPADQLLAAQSALENRLAVDRVLRLHQPSSFLPGEDPTGEVCRKCDEDYPCSTVRALNGDYA